MIVRTLGGWHHLVRQSEHARQSAVLTASLRPEFLGAIEDQWALMQATAMHDVGWDAWDDAPQVDAAGLPLNFDAVDKAVGREVWRHTVYGALVDHGPAVAAILARHASALAMLDVVGDPPAEDYHFEEMLPHLEARAWPADAPEARTARRERAFAALALGDALSLLGLAGWSHRLTLPLHREDGTTLEVTAWREGDWTVRVAPWPFAVPGALANVWTDTVAVPAAEARDAVAILRAPRQYHVRRTVEYREG